MRLHGKINDTPALSSRAVLVPTSNSRPDLPDAEVTESDQETSAARMGLASSARVSAKTGQGVDKAFERLIMRVYEVEHGRGQPIAPPKEAPPRGIVLANSKSPVQEEKMDCCL